MKEKKSKDHLLQVQGLFISHIGELRSFVAVLMPDYSQVDDIVQEVFLVVSEKAVEFELGTNFRAWLFMIARFRVLKAYNRMGRGYLPLSEGIVDKLSQEVAEAQSGTSVEQERRIRLLEICIEKLAPQARRMIKLRYFEGFKPGVIARDLKLSVNGVSVLLSRSRAQLRSCIELLSGGADSV